MSLGLKRGCVEEDGGGSGRDKGFLGSWVDTRKDHTPRPATGRQAHRLLSGSLQRWPALCGAAAAIHLTPAKDAFAACPVWHGESPFPSPASRHTKDSVS